MASFFHSYDLRGKHPDEIDVEEAEKVGKAFGTFTDADKVLVGRDGRQHGEKITGAFISGLLSTGTDVVDAGMVPSPVVYFGMVDRNIESAAVVTASHNPPKYTGFKFCKENALAMSRKGGMREIEEIYETEEFVFGKHGEKTEVDLGEDYVEFVSERISLDRELEVAVNFGNGVTGPLGRKMLEAIGCEVKGINEEVDGSFPNHLPDPTNEKAREALEREMNGEDLGIILDGDGDRAGFILPGYGLIDEDQLLGLFAEECLEKKSGKVVHDLRASKLVPEIIEGNEGEPAETRVGHTFISEEIHSESSIVFAGELSGHFYFPVFDVPWDDGLFSAALMCQIVSEIGLQQKLENYPDYPASPELRIDCPEKAKQKVVEEMKKEYSDKDLSTMDGVKIKFEKGWVLVRPSNTEEKMSVRCEADTEKDVERILGEVRGRVEEAIEEFG